MVFKLRMDKGASRDFQETIENSRSGEQIGSQTPPDEGENLGFPIVLHIDASHNKIVSSSGIQKSQPFPSCSLEPSKRHLVHPFPLLISFTVNGL